MVTIKRGPTDTIGKAVFPHEIPILEEIHGEGNVERVTDTDPDGRRLMRTALRGKGPVVRAEVFPEDDPLADPTIEMKHFDPADNPREEYQRMVQVYGMHIEQPLPNVEVVYGRFQEGRFTAALKGASVTGRAKLSLADIDAMRGPELQERLAAAGVEFDPKAPAKELRRQLAEHVGA
jgi:hypothetical protein